MARKFVFNFPLSRFAPSNAEGYTRRGQADQITQEAAEAFSAAESGDERTYVVELLDCIHACETALSEFDDALISDAWQEVVYKNAERGYYDDFAMASFVNDELAREDPVDHPSHYMTSGSVESIDIVERIIDGLEAKHAYCLANVLKYALRAGKKGTLDIDLEKANNYAHRLCTGEWRWQHGKEA